MKKMPREVVEGMMHTLREYNGNADIQLYEGPSKSSVMH